MAKTDKITNAITKKAKIRAEKTAKIKLKFDLHVYLKYAIDFKDISVWLRIICDDCFAITASGLQSIVYKGFTVMRSHYR